MRICIDIDGTIAEHAFPANQPVPENPGSVDWLQISPTEGAVQNCENLFNEGHTIILFTARPSKDREITEMWLNKNGFKYHLLIMDKPLADIYIDDKGHEHYSWDKTAQHITHKIRRHQEAMLGEAN